jgi:hypothetical protein
MVSISIAFAAGKIRVAFEHSTIWSSQSGEIDFLLFDFPRQCSPGEVGKSFFSARDRLADFSVETVWNLKGYRLHRNTECNTVGQPVIQWRNFIVVCHLSEVSP